MSQEQYTPISPEMREEIERGMRDGLSYRMIGEIIDKDHTVVQREVGRNGKPSQNKTTRVNRPNEYNLDSRHFRGTKRVDEIRKRKEAYERRKRDFMRNQATYDAKVANKRAWQRKSQAMKICHPPKLSLPGNGYLLAVVIALLKLRWSPEQISLRFDLLNTLLVCLGSPPLLPTISHTAIYNYIKWREERDKERAAEKGAQHSRGIKLVKYLRRKGKPYRHEKKPEYNQTDRSKHSIHDRPKAIDNKERYGDLEGDTIVGKDTKDRILTHTERITGLVALQLVLAFNAMKITKATIKSLKRVYRQSIRSSTYDNGIEFSAWLKTEEELKTICTNVPNPDETLIYFADPYTPSQRGCNENANGLVRDFFPKGTDFKQLTQHDILEAESLLNNRPRKRLAGLTPLEVWQMVQLTE